MEPFWLWALLGANGLTFVVWGWDKWRASRGGRRVPEASLLFLALCGGFVGAWIGVRVFRHKTRKQPFRLYLMLVTLLSAGLGVFLFLRGGFEL